MITRSLFPLIVTGLISFSARAEDLKQDEFYRITPLQAPDGAVIEAGGMDTDADGNLFVSTRRGEVWKVSNLSSDTPAWTRFAESFHEPLGVAVKDDWVYVTQRPDITRMRDTDDDGKADEFEIFSAEWGLSGNYHEYNFGSRFSPSGSLFAALCLTQSFHSDAPFRGWAVEIGADGRLTPYASGIRSPGGIGFDQHGEVFYTDNQGTWNGSSALKWLKKGSFQGNPNGNVWYDRAREISDSFPSKPQFPQLGDESQRMVSARREIPQLIPSAVIFPHNRIGNSPTGIALDSSGGAFGPFTGQLFVGEQTHSKLHRVILEKVNGQYQGAVIPFLEGFSSGNIAVHIDETGQLFTGGSNRGWGARGGELFHADIVTWTGKTPFEILDIKIQPTGFLLTFTKPIDPASLPQMTASAETYGYIYQEAYGSPEVDKTTPDVSVSEGPDDSSIMVTLPEWQLGNVHEISLEGLRSRTGDPLWHETFYYTVNEVPSIK